MPFLDQADLPSKEVFPGYVAKMVHTENLTMVYWTIAAGAAIPEHSHLHEQITHVLSGEFELTVEGDPKRLVPGIIAVIPSHAKHFGRAISECSMLDVFYPVRMDYKNLMG